MSAPHPDPVRKEREDAWLGDAVLSLYARQYILRTTGVMGQEEFAAMTSNSFLSAIGPPTRVESWIGLEYQKGGLTAAFDWIETRLLPLYLKQKKNRR
ncbi:MAG: ribonuclease III domain-containing protein [Verrucomicrobiota bacterium]